MGNVIHYKHADTEEELIQIIALQKRNLPENIDETTLAKEGFVTIKHELKLLRSMNEAYPHTIAVAQGQVIGYTLVMLSFFRNQIPVLIPMFERIDELTFQGNKLSEIRYFIMGQVCVHEEYRGKGIFAGLYHHMKKTMQNHFDLNVTQIALRNPRSIRAHEKVGFEVIEEYASGGEEWVVVAWDWK